MLEKQRKLKCPKKHYEWKYIIENDVTLASEFQRESIPLIEASLVVLLSGSVTCCSGMKFKTVSKTIFASWTNDMVSLITAPQIVFQFRSPYLNV